MITIGPEVEWAISIALATLTTLATILAIGVAFLARPGKPTLYWSFAFVLAMLSTVGLVAADMNDTETVRRICLGLLLGVPALLWSGFRALWNVRPHVWAGAVVSVLSAAVFVAMSDSVYLSSAYRWAFLLSSAFAALLVIDWVRFAGHRDRFVIPLVIMSVLFFLLAVATVVTGFIYPPTSGDDLILVRLVGSLGMLAYGSCAVAAVVGVSTRDSPLTRVSVSSTRLQRFERVATNRLARAQGTGDPMSMLCLRLDDVEELRQVAGSHVLAQVCDNVEAELRATLPEESVISPSRVGTFFVLVPGADIIVRDLLRTTMERVALQDIPGRLTIHPSVSAGWAPTSTVGYDAQAMMYLSREAANLADQKGGDRWERVNPAVVARLLSPQLRR